MTHKSLHPHCNFEMLSRLNEMDWCGPFFTEWQTDLDQCSVKKVHTSPARIAVRAFQSCQGECQLLLVDFKHRQEIEEKQRWTGFFFLIVKKRREKTQNQLEKNENYKEACTQMKKLQDHHRKEFDCRHMQYRVEGQRRRRNKATIWRHNTGSERQTAGNLRGSWEETGQDDEMTGLDRTEGEWSNKQYYNSIWQKSGTQAEVRRMRQRLQSSAILNLKAQVEPILNRVYRREVDDKGIEAMTTSFETWTFWYRQREFQIHLSGTFVTNCKCPFLSWRWWWGAL